MSPTEEPDAAADAGPNRADDGVVADTTILVRAEHHVDLENATYAQDDFTVDFFGGPTWTAYGVTFPVGKCSNDGSGVQLNYTGEGKSTGSNAIELVPSDGSGRATLDFRWTASDGLRVDVAIGNVSRRRRRFPDRTREHAGERGLSPGRHREAGA